MESLRILHGASMVWRGGIPSAVTSLCLGLRSLGHEVALVHEAGDVRDLEAHGVLCHRADLSMSSGGLVRGTLPLRGLMRRFRPPVVHVHERAVAMRCRLVGRPADWYTLHNMQGPVAPGLID